MTQEGGDIQGNLAIMQMETLRATNLGGLERGNQVNFERSARVGDEIGGHNVSGHIHVTGVCVCVWNCGQKIIGGGL